jgi:hypothetical protein
MLVTRSHPRGRSAVAAVSALVVPVACVAIDLLVRGRDLPPALAPTYAAGAALSFAIWALGMEAARHPRRAVRVAATTFLAVTAASCTT